MSLINYASKEVTLKIVYYGPGLSGKTTNLQHLHATVSPENRGKLLSLATESDRTLFFDFMPMTLGKIGDFTVKFQLYTVPGQVRYNATRKLVLKGADAIVFVADSQKALKEQNIESYENMLENLKANNIDPDEIPIVLQYNKRDLDEVMSINVLNKDLNSAGHLTINAEAVNGTGVEETFQLVTQVLLKHFSEKHKIGFSKPPAKEEPPKPPEAIKEPPAPVKAPEKAPEPVKETPAPPKAREPEVEKAPPKEEKPVEAKPVKEKPAPPPPPPPEPEEVEVEEESEPAPEPEAEGLADMAAGPLTEEDRDFPSLGAMEPLTETEESLEEETLPSLEAEEERRTLQKELEEMAFAEREMPSIEDMAPSAEEHDESTEAASAAVGDALKEISNIVKETQMGAWMEKLVNSLDSTNRNLSDLVSELKDSRKNQEKMLDILKKIESSIKPSGKSSKKS